MELNREVMREEQPEEKKDRRQFLIQRPDKKAIWLGGVYNDVANEETGEVRRHFALFTTPRTGATESEIEQFFRPANTEGWEVYEVAKKQIDWEDDDPRLLEPKGERMVADG